MKERTVEGGAIDLTFPVYYHSRVEDKRLRKMVTLKNEETVLLLRHPSNMGYPGILEWRKDSPYAGILSIFEHIPRMRKIIDEEIVPLLDLARRIGIQIMYVVNGWDSAGNYPQWQKISSRVPEPEPGTFMPEGLKYTEFIEPRSPQKKWRKEFEAEAFMPGYREALAQLRKVIDIAPPLKPRPEDWVVTTTRQAAVLMSERRIWNILNAGFDINDGMIYSEMGIYWCRDFRPIILEDCTAGRERHDTVETESLKKATITFLEMTACSARGSEIRRAIESSLKRKEAVASEKRK